MLRVVTEEKGHAVLFLDVHETVAYLVEFGCTSLEFGIDAVGQAFMSKNAAPIGLLTIVECGPMPVFHHVGTTREERVHVLAQLTIVGRPLVTAGPSGTLCIGFGDEEVVVLRNGTHEVARIAYPGTILLILHVVIDVDGRIFHLAEGLHLVDVAEIRHEAMEDKLIGTTIFVDDIDLPVEEVGGHLAVPAFPPHLVRGVGHTFAVVEVLPFVDVHAPVVEAPATVEFLEVAVELLLDVFAETLKKVGVVDVACLDFVVHLIADDGGMLGKVLHHLADDAFAVTQIGGVLEVHVLTDAVVTLLVVDGV